MSTQANESPLKVPALPTAGNAIEGLAKGLGNVGVDGMATFEIALPISTGRGYAPTLSLIYRSKAGTRTEPHDRISIYTTLGTALDLWRGSLLPLAV